MCGILGWMTTSETNIADNTYRKGIGKLFTLSESRGKEASGVCCVTDGDIQILKAPLRAKKLVASEEYCRYLDNVMQNKKRLVMGHARMVTNGSVENANNNQPIIRGDLVCIHNGIIVNDESIWTKYPDLKRRSEVDTEVLLALLEKYGYKIDFGEAFEKALADIEGSLSIALVDRSSDWLFLYTNTGSLYFAIPDARKDIIFSSERYILEQMIRSNMDLQKQRYRILSVESGEGYIIRLSDASFKRYRSHGKGPKIHVGRMDRSVIVNSVTDKTVENTITYHKGYERKKIGSLLRVDIEKIHRLRRCTKCLLPETFPGISFDEEGVCSICRDYNKISPKGRNAFVSDLSRFHTSDSRYNCISPISGGRDSCYILHYLVNELHLKPVAYTYDWGLVTDLARRNIHRMCSMLGVEHILISADIQKKRNNVKKNVEAWLKHPTLGTVPLFMAGDKQFFYYAQLLKRQMRVDNVVFGMNRMEETQFKARFIGLENHGNMNDVHYNFSSRNKLGLLTGYGKEFVKNPSYLNESLFDSFTGFLSYYALPQRFLRFFDYIPWSQETIERTLIEEYGWETATDTGETWRIGDGTAPFYNYIYYRIAGFTEFDTFRSNQIREGMITREQGLSTLDDANTTPVDGFLWYCETIGLDPVSTIQKINDQVPLYEKI